MAAPKKSKRELDIIKKLDTDIAEMRKKTHKFQDDNPMAQYDSGVTDLAEVIHSGVLPTAKKRTIH